MKYYLNSEEFQSAVKAKTTGSTRKSIGVQNLRIINVRLPNINEQIKISNFLSAIDIKINYTQTQIEKAELWKKGLLQKMFV